MVLTDLFIAHEGERLGSFDTTHRAAQRHLRGNGSTLCGYGWVPDLTSQQLRDYDLLLKVVIAGVDERRKRVFLGDWFSEQKWASM